MSLNEGQRHALHSRPLKNLLTPRASKRGWSVGQIFSNRVRDLASVLDSCLPYARSRESGRMRCFTSNRMMPESQLEPRPSHSLVNLARSLAALTLLSSNSSRRLIKACNSPAQGGMPNFAPPVISAM